MTISHDTVELETTIRRVITSFKDQVQANSLKLALDDLVEQYEAATHLDENGNEPPTWAVDASNNPTGLVAPSGLIIYQAPLDVRLLGAKCDGRVVNDAVTAGRSGIGSLVLTSATASFEQADVGKSYGLTVNSATGAANYTVYCGTVQSVESATSCTLLTLGTTAAIASGGSFILGTNDATAIGLAITRLTSRGGTLLFPGISVVGSGFTLPAGVSMRGVGRGKSNALGWVVGGSGLVKCGSYAAGNFIETTDRGCTFSDMTIDAGNKSDDALYIGYTGYTIQSCNIARGLNIALKLNAGTGSVMQSQIWQGFRGVALEAGGDANIGSGNYIFGAGDTFANVYLNGPTDDFQLHKNHIYKGGWGVTLSTVTGPNVYVLQWMTSNEAGGVIDGNSFDTAEGHHIQVTQNNVSAVKPISGLAIVSNIFFQPQSAWTTDTYSCINFTIGSSGTNHVYCQALSIHGNVGKGNTSGSKAYKSFINTTLLATYGHIIGAGVVNNNIANCNLGYSGSWVEGGTPGSTAPDVGANLNTRIAGVGTTATAF